MCFAAPQIWLGRGLPFLISPTEELFMFFILVNNSVTTPSTRQKSLKAILVVSKNSLSLFWQHSPFSSNAVSSPAWDPLHWRFLWVLLLLVCVPDASNGLNSKYQSLEHGKVYWSRRHQSRKWGTSNPYKESTEFRLLLHEGKGEWEG